MSITGTTATLDSRPSPGREIRLHLAAGILGALLVALSNATYPTHEALLPHDSLGEILARGTLRVASRVDPAGSATEAFGPSGIEEALARDFAAELGVELEIVPAANSGEALAALDGGRADLAAAGLAGPAGARDPHVYSAPWLDVSQQVVYRTGSPRPRSTADLVGMRVMVLAHGSSAAALRRAQQALPTLSWREATRIETAALLQQLAEGSIDHVVLKSHEFYMHEGLFPSLAVAFELAEPEQLAWAMAHEPRNQRLQERMNEYLAEREASGDLDLLRQRFFGYLPEINRQALTAFAERAERSLPRLERLLRRVGEQEGVDWRLLAAMSYQESHWNPAAASRKGAVGMMMLTPRAAAEVGVSDRSNMEQSLRGGARYFQKLVKELDPQLAAADRELFALAAYNIGLGHLEDARRLARLRGADPNLWADVEKQLPLLARSEWRRHTRNGYARGLETAAFVSRVRQYHRYLTHHDESGDLYLALNSHIASVPGS